MRARDFGSFSEITVLMGFVAKAPSLIEGPSYLMNNSEKQLDFGSGKSAAVAAGYCSLSEMRLLIGSCLGFVPSLAPELPLDFWSY